MKEKLLIAICLLTISLTNAQIEIETVEKKSKINAVPYDGEFMSFNDVYDEEKKAGVVGELVTLLDISYVNLFKSQEDAKNYKNISYANEKKFENKTFEVTDYKYDYGDYLTIKKDEETFVWKVGYTDKYVFNKYIDKIKDKFEGKSFVPLYLESDFEAMDGSKFKILGQNKYVVTKVKFAKIGLNYGIVFNVNNNFDCVFPNGSYDQPTVFNGKIYTSNKNYVNIQSSNILGAKVTLLEENEFKKFTAKNKTYLDKIRAKKVQLGMNETQCRWAWGTPNNSFENIAGYDKVLVYGSTGNSQNLYFKNGYLKLIK